MELSYQKLESLFEVNNQREESITNELIGHVN